MIERLSRALAAAALTLLLTAPALAEKPDDPHSDGKPVIDPDTEVVPAPDPPVERNPKEDINKLLYAERSVLEAMEELDINISRRTSQKALLEKKQAVIDEDLARASKEFAAQTEALEAARKLVRRRLRAMIQLKKTEAYQVLFASETYATFLRRNRALKGLLEADAKRISSYREQLDRWRTAKADLERRKNNLQHTKQTIEYLLAELRWDREEKQALLEAVRERRAFHDQVGREVQEVDKQQKERIKALEAKRSRLWFEENKGKLTIPIRRGKTIGKFGLRKNRKFGTRTVHHGIDMVPKDWDGKSEVPVHAIYWGYVVHAGWVRGLGNTVILDHTQGYMSVYAHLDTIDVKVGDKIRTATQLGTMGDSGSLYGKRLYMEIREDGRAIDPNPWFK